MNTAFMIGKNLKTGELYAEEYGRHNRLKGQTSFDEIQVNPETGEVLEEKQPVNVEIVDFRKVMT